MSGEKRARKLLTPRFILEALAVFVIGSLLGVGTFTVVYAKGWSYLGNDPQTCMNCHVMEPYYKAWSAGSHAGQAGCNDCHAPHDNIVSKYYVKAENGFWHSFKFTTGWYPDNIEIRDSNRQVTNEACLYCHSDLTSDMHITAGDEQIQCMDCHTNVGHKVR
ncbi:MAG: cytochrome c nitrite reductase small subunit [Actinomycetaceae bacterium]|nr:cytochrome c nitrite reductase small subunit [Actinomycetaceae bacterium]